MVDQAGVMAGTMTTDAGYGNSDNDGYGFKIQVSDSGTQPVKLMVTGFDYEYFSRDVKIRDINEQRRKVKINDGEGIEELFFNSHTRSIARAAACVMHQAYGWNLPESVEFWL